MRDVQYPDVLVLGAGIIGLSTAVALAEAGVRVQVDAAEPPHQTTSAAAGAMWRPYRVEPRDRALTWGFQTLEVLERIADDKLSGVRLTDGVEAGRTAYRPPEWAARTAGRPAAPEELPQGFAAGWRYRVPLIDMPVYLDYLLRRLTAAGGTLRIQRHDRMPSGPIVVNCTGSGARSLVPDVDVTTVRGQLVVMENPGITEFFCAVDDDETTELLYYMPHGERIVVGGVAQPGRWDRSPDPQSAHGILERCLRIQPRLARARIIGQTAGLRPIRPSVRLEKDGRVIHNYGHGGGGVTLSWGCAAVVADLVRQF